MNQPNIVRITDTLIVNLEHLLSCSEAYDKNVKTVCFIFSNGSAIRIGDGNSDYAPALAWLKTYGKEVPQTKKESGDLIPQCPEGMGNIRKLTFNEPRPVGRIYYLDEVDNKWVKCQDNGIKYARFSAWICTQLEEKKE